MFLTSCNEGVSNVEVRFMCFEMRVVINEKGMTTECAVLPV
jgi:hypothetical protein